MYFGYSAGDGSNWGWSSDILITAEERYPSGSYGPAELTLSQFAYTTSKSQTTVDSTSFVEPSSDYRVTITPSAADAIIRIRFQVPTNPGVNYATNTIYTFRTFRVIDGVTSYDLTSAGDSVGSRNAFAGLSIRPVGYDSNDMMWANWECIDIPGTTSEVIYGFDFKRGK